MVSSLIKRQMEKAFHDMLYEKVSAFVKNATSMQWGKSVFENFQLPGKRELIVTGVVIVAVQLTASTVRFVIARKSEEQRVERIVRRVLEEERLEAEIEE